MSVVDDIRHRLTSARDNGEITPATVTRLLLAIHAAARDAGLPPADDPLTDPAPRRRLVAAGGITIDEARDAAWANRRRRADVD